MTNSAYRLIITIVDQRLTGPIVDVVRKVGGQAVTIVRGRGRDLVMPPTFLGIPVEPEREVLYLVLEADRVEAVVDAIHAAGDLDRPGRGLVLVVDLARVAGFVPRGTEPGQPGPLIEP